MEALIEKRKAEKQKKGGAAAWEETEAEPKGLFHTVKYAMPTLWKGGIGKKLLFVTNIFLLILAKVLNTAHPLVLKEGIDALTVGTSAMWFIVGYVLLKLAADTCRNLQEMTFVQVAANAEV